VIVVGPELSLHQCGLPKKMALELFKPFIYHRLEQSGQCTTIKAAKEMVERQEPVVWDILEEVIGDHPVLLNRAPTLHRLGIQAFEPVLVEGKAIKIHPLVCTAFNADFDGDQMAVHIPLSPEAQIEASVLMLSSRNILSPANGQPLAVPSQDIVLGIYYLTKEKKGGRGEGRSFANADEVLLALEAEEVETLTPVRLRYTGPVIDLTTGYDDQDVLHTEPITVKNQFIDTTVGRVIFNDHLPKEMPYVNGLLRKKGLGALVNFCYLRFGLETTVKMLDQVKALGFLYATRAGISIGIDDLIVPVSKAVLVNTAEKEVIEVEKQYQDGAITHGERYNKVIAIWSSVTDRVADEMFQVMESQDKLGELNPIYIMADSGARGSKQQIRQLSGMRGLMAKPSGEIIETPITANFREGLPRTARGRVWPTRRSRPPTPATSPAGWWTWRRTSSSPSSTAGRWTAFTSSPSSRPAKWSSLFETASWAASPSSRSKTTRATSSSTSIRKSTRTWQLPSRLRASSG
jgi:DNA-directed RNA polymerase subunit beta'